MSVRMIAAAALIAASATGAVLAQDWTQSPNFGSTSLNPGFMPDPYNVSIVAGGMIDASGVGCAGMISNAPDYRLQWSGGRIKISAQSGSDTTLVVNGPNGQWYCSDDVNGLNPELVMSGSGQYDIWVGTYGGGTATATLSFSEF